MFTSPSSSTGAIMLEIIILMLVAAIIGFVIAYLLFKNRWAAEKLLLEGEIKQYRDQLETASAEASRYNQNWSECKKRNQILEPLVQEVTDLKNKNQVQEAALTQGQTRIKELEDELARLAAENSRMTQELVTCKDKLSGYADYNQIKSDLATSKDDNAELSLALTACQKSLNTRGGALPPAEDSNGIQALTGKNKSTSKPATSKKKATREEQLAAVAAKRETIDFGRIGVATESDKDDLKRISGVGPFIEAKLNALGIFTFRQIGNFTDDDTQKVTDAIEFFPGRIQRDDWVGQALGFLGEKPKKEKAKGKKKPTREEQLAAIAAKKDTLNFDRIGVAAEGEKDDLKKISGIGPFIEAKLNALGIFSFRQIGNFSDEDKSKVNEAIEFFPGRIERDDWVGQAKAFHTEG